MNDFKCLISAQVLPRLLITQNRAQITRASGARQVVQVKLASKKARQTANLETLIYISSDEELIDLTRIDSELDADDDNDAGWYSDFDNEEVGSYLR